MPDEMRARSWQLPWMLLYCLPRDGQVASGRVSLSVKPRPFRLAALATLPIRIAPAGEVYFLPAVFSSPAEYPSHGPLR